MRLLGNRAYNLTHGDGADVLQREDSRLSLKWDKWGGMLLLGCFRGVRLGDMTLSFLTSSPKLT